MTAEELLTPRIKIINDWPGNNIPVGTILPYDKSLKDSNPCYRDGKYLVWESDVKNCPHLFKEIQWWEKRDVKDMPEYVKTKKESLDTARKFDFSDFPEYAKVESWGIWDSEHRFPDTPYCVLNNQKYIVTHFTPATETEYTEYLKSKTN